MKKVKTNPTRAPGRKNRKNEVRIRFPYVKENKSRPTFYGRDFMVFWKDQFGSVNFAAAGDWTKEMEAVETGVRAAYLEVTAGVDVE